MPDLGALIQGGGGLRKVRWAGESRGKRGGVRVIYYLIHRDKIYFVYIYSKTKQGDLTDAQVKWLRRLIEEEH